MKYIPLDKEISYSKKLASLSIKAYALYLTILPHLDSYGKMLAEPGIIKGQVVPLRNDISQEEIPLLLEEISQKTYMKWFKKDGLLYIHDSKAAERYPSYKLKKRGIDRLPSYNNSQALTEQNHTKQGITEPSLVPSPDPVPTKDKPGSDQGQTRFVPDRDRDREGDGEKRICEGGSPPSHSLRPKIIFNREKGIFENLNYFKDKWQAAYPAVDIDLEIKKAEAWVLANPKNAKSNWARFLTSWLTRAQDRAGRAGFAELTGKQPLSRSRLKTIDEIRQERAEREKKEAEIASKGIA